MAPEERDANEAERVRNAQEKKESREARAEMPGTLARFLLSVALVILVLLFIIVMWPPMKSLLIRFAQQMQTLFSSVEQFH